MVDGYQKLIDSYQKLENDYQKLVDGWKIWQIFSCTQILYLQDYIDKICSELTTFAVESPTGCINIPEEVLNYMNKNHAASDSLYVLPV